MTAAAFLVAIALGAGSPDAAAPQEYRIVKVTHYGKHKHRHKTRRACRRHWDRRCRRHVHRRRVLIPAPPPQPAPAPLPPAPAPPPAPTPAPPPAPPLPSRTSVDLTEWRVTPSYRELRAGEVEFNAANLGEDEHDFSVRDASGTVLANEVVLVGDSVTVRLTLAPASYTLFCSLPDHEANGMRATVSVR